MCQSLDQTALAGTWRSVQENAQLVRIAFDCIFSGTILKMMNCLRVLERSQGDRQTNKLLDLEYHSSCKINHEIAFQRDFHFLIVLKKMVSSKILLVIAPAIIYCLPGPPFPRGPEISGQDMESGDRATLVSPTFSTSSDNSMGQLWSKVSEDSQDVGEPPQFDPGENTRSAQSSAGDFGGALISDESGSSRGSRSENLEKWDHDSTDDARAMALKWMYDEKSSNDVPEEFSADEIGSSFDIPVPIRKRRGSNRGLTEQSQGNEETRKKVRFS